MKDNLRKALYMGTGAFIGAKVGTAMKKRRLNMTPKQRKVAEERRKVDRKLGSAFIMLAIIGAILMFICLIVGLATQS